MNNTSPIPLRTPRGAMSFPSAIQKIMDGERVRRAEWTDLNVYGFLKDEC